MASAAKKPAKKPAKKAAKTAAKPAAKKTASSKAAGQKPPARAAKTSVKAVAAKPVPKAASLPSKAASLPPLPAVEKPVPIPPPKPKKSPFSPKDLETIKQRLLAQRQTLENEAADLKAGTFDTSQSELSGEVAFDEEYADAGTFTFERERDLSLSNNIRDLTDKIDTALVKIERRTYGICERCGERIDKERMKALPYAVLCIRCKRLEERRR